MGYEFTVDEITEVIRAARIFCPGFSEREYQDLLEMEECFKGSGYLEAVRALARLKEEKGISSTEALDACKQLLEDKEQLEAEVASFGERLEAQQDANRKAEDRCQQLKEAIEQAKAELEAILTERQEEEKELVGFRNKAEREKRRTDKEVEEYQEKAKVTEEDMVTAGQLKAEVESHGLNLELVLGLSQEFAGHENARHELAKVLKEYQTLTNYVAAFNKEVEAHEKTLKSDLDKLQSEKDRRQTEINSLEQARRQLESILSQLQADVAQEEELRRFYHRYQGTGVLLESLAGWNQIFFLRCNNPLYALTGFFDRSAGGAQVWTDKAGAKCPHCGLNTLVYDERLYQALNLPIGAPLKLQLGE
jgi:DNA repair exonuclease SbcCD ATPase subunit